MAYIGKQPLVGNYISCDSLSASATTTYNLTSNGTAVYPTVPQNCLVSLNGVVQAPVTSYTISGATIVFSTVLSTTDTIDYVTVLGSTLNIGTPSDGTVTSAKLASGVSGLISWQSVQTSGFTAVASRGYPCNTTSAAFTVTLPASPIAGDTIILVDYAGTFATNNITLGANGNKINGATDNKVLSTNREAVTITYVDSTQGWVASSGVNSGSQALDPLPYSIDFLVVAGGGGGGGKVGATYDLPAGAGGAGGFRTSTQTVTAGTVITVTVGDGGAGGSNTSAVRGASGSNSSISGSGLTTITSAGGGGGGASTTPYSAGTNDGASGGSGGAGGVTNSTAPTGGSGNTPSTSPSQGSNGANGNLAPSNEGGSGGGGASAVGSTGSGNNGGNGGNGSASSITGSSVTYAGGGGGGARTAPASIGTGGTGGGGNGGARDNNGSNGTANLGGGGGGSGSGNTSSGSGGKGVVILRMLTANYTGTTTGSPTVTTDGSYKVLQFNGDGSYTA